MASLIYSLAEKSGGARLMQYAGRNTGSQVYVLTYHRVDTPDHRPWLNPDLINTSPAQFAQQMALVQRCYQPVGIEAVLEAVNGGKKLPRQAVLVTVDDGYQDFQETILPICNQFGIRPLLFVPTAYVGQGIFWWDKLYQIIYRSGREKIWTKDGEQLTLTTPQKRRAALEHISQSIKYADFQEEIRWLDLLYAESLEKAGTDLQGNTSRHTLDWDELRQVSRRGADLAAHTHTHPILGQLPIDPIRQEIRQSRAIIRSELGTDLPVFAYPDGVEEAISPEARQVIREEGYQLAFTMQAGRADLERDSRDYLPRLGTWSRLSIGHFHLRMTPLFDKIQSKQRKHG